MFTFLQINVTGTSSPLPVLTEPTATEKTLSLLELTLSGGVIMIPLVIFSIIVVYIFIERYLAINKARKIDDNFMNAIRDFIHDGKIDAAKALCKNTNSPVAKMVEKGLARLGKPLNDISIAIENVANLEVAKLEKNLSTVATISGAAPMLGFLGTVIGMIRAFYNMANSGGNIEIKMLAGGIYEAMVTTVGGLIVGILAYIAYNILVAKVQKVIYLLEAKSLEFLDLLNEPAKK